MSVGPLIIHLRINPDLNLSSVLGFEQTIDYSEIENNQDNIEDEFVKRLEQREIEDKIRITEKEVKPWDDFPIALFRIKTMYELFNHINHNYMNKYTRSTLISSWPKQTDIHCFWCTESFSWCPFGLPFEYVKPDDNSGMYMKTEGVFCSLNCAMAYNLNKRDNLTPERASLLHLMFYHLFKTDELKKKSLMSFEDFEISPALPKEMLNKFGGPLTIQEYRNLHHYPIYYNESDETDNENFLKIKSNVEKSKIQVIQYPPHLISVIPQNEIICSIKSKNEEVIKTYHIKEFTNEETFEDDLKLKRSKPVHNPKQTLSRFLEKEL